MSARDYGEQSTGGKVRPPSRWEWMGPASLWVTLTSAALSCIALGLTWAYLQSPRSLAPIFWCLGGASLCALGNLAGQTLALFGLFPGGRSRRQSILALVIGIAALAAFLVGVLLIFWKRGFLAL